jgi:hypothetical protein
MNQDEITMLAVEAAAKEDLNAAVLEISLREDLSSDFIKRLIEATNKLAYLSRMTKGDRTIEFPLADYDTVMGSIAVPSEIEKAASVSIRDMFSYDMEKVAEHSDEVRASDIYREAQACRREIEELSVTRDSIMTKIASDSSRIAKRDDFDVAVQHYDTVREFFKKEASDHRKLAPSALLDVKYLSDNLEKLAEIDATLSSRKATLNRADEFLKKAMAPLLVRGASMLASAGSKMGSKLGKVKGVSKLKKGVGMVEAAGMASEVRNRAKKNYNPWSDLRG